MLDAEVVVDAKPAKRTKRTKPISEGAVLTVRVTQAELNAWRAKAEADGRTLSSWVRFLCNRTNAIVGGRPI